MNHQRNPGEVSGVSNLNWKRPDDSLGSRPVNPLSSANRLTTGGTPQTRNWNSVSAVIEEGRVTSETVRNRVSYQPLKEHVLQKTRNDLLTISSNSLFYTEGTRAQRGK